MTIAMLCGQDKEHNEALSSFIEAVKKQLLAIDPSLDLQLWPNISKPEEIECALVCEPPPGELKKYPNLKGIFCLTAGVDFLMQQKDRPKDVPITRIVDPEMANDMTRHAVKTTLNQMLQTDHWETQQKQKNWDRNVLSTYCHETVGIMGFGFLGSHVAKALVNLGIKVAGWSQSEKNMEQVTSFAGKDGFKPFLQSCDILISLLPHTPKTTNILNRNTFAELPDGAYLINLSRGEIIQEDDLLDALNSRKLSGASLDVFRVEPLPEAHPFWEHPKIKITPHIAALTQPQTIAEQVYNNIQRSSKGEPLLNLVDPQRGY